MRMRVSYMNSGMALPTLMSDDIFEHKNCSGSGDASVVVGYFALAYDRRQSITKAFKEAVIPSVSVASK